MPKKTEFTCKNCKKTVQASNFWNTSSKGLCPTHKDICFSCLKTKGIFTTKYVCPKCDKETPLYEYHEGYGKWMKKKA